MPMGILDTYVVSSFCKAEDGKITLQSIKLMEDGNILSLLLAKP